ncbi:MAG: hypothetical protein EBZ77_12500, partial [Chitinophagia bacterium]|nr:hypothetical protein [Chitinophagia bacterium]
MELEYTSMGLGIASGVSVTATRRIGVFADTGYTAMRVRTSGGPLTFGSGDACTYLANGVTRDYVVRVTPGTPCSGTPSGGTAYSNATAVCGRIPFTLSDTTATADVGITYQWQYRPIGSSLFADIPGATNTTYAVTTQTVTTDYHLITTCTASGGGASSNNIQVRTLPFYSCYCGSPLGTTASGINITNVQIPGSTLHIRGSYTTPYRSFINVGDSTGRYQRSLSYNMNLTVAGGSTWNAAMWIDYNRDATFQTSEYILLDTALPSGRTSVRNFTIPATADTGITGMRIRVTPTGTSIGNADACTFFTNSQTFDVKIRIDTLVNCSGTPNAGIVSSTSPFACPAMTFALSDSGYDVGGGLSYQWYKRTTGGFTAISGATSYATTISGQTATTTYALVARCSYSGLTDTSNQLVITEYPFDSCYCSPPTGVPLVTTGGDSIILIAAVSSTTMYSGTHSPGTTGYTQVPPTLAANTATITRNTAYTATLFVNYTRYSVADAGMWIDQDHSGTFDSSEYIHLVQASTRNYWSGTINLPRTTQLGLTGMRFTATKTGTISPSGSCNTIAGGQVQDYIITINRPPCYAISSIRATGITDSGATVSWSPLSGAAGYEYVINTSSADPTVSGTATTDTFVNFNCLTSNTTYYVHVRDSCGAGDLSGDGDGFELCDG